MSALAVRAAGVVVAVAVTVGIGRLSQFQWSSDPRSHSVIRLAWRTRSTRVQECRTPTEEELAGVPAHMRPREICEGRLLPYRLTVVLDGDEVIDETVRGAGARGDRPLFVFREFPVASGAHSLRVRFEREDGGGADSDNLALTPGVLELDRELVLREKEISLVTYDPEARALVVRGYGSD